MCLQHNGSQNWQKWLHGVCPVGRRTTPNRERRSIMRKKRGKGIVAAILAVCMACSTAPAMSAAIPKDEGVTIDDTEFQYSAGDANNGGWTAGGWGDATTTEHWANVPDAWAKIQFNGTDLEIYGKKAPNHRMFSVGIDGVTVECDAYDATATGNNQVLFSTQTSGFELEAGDHTATVTVLEKKNDAATQVLGMNLAYAKAYGGETPDMEAPEFPGYTDIDDSVTTTTGEPFKITYEPTENWHQESGYNQFFNGTDTYSDRNVDVSYQMEFTGTGVAIYASKNTAHANCDVYIDGKLVGTAEGNLASGATQHKQLIFEKKDLENSTHTLKVVPAEGYGDKAMQHPFASRSKTARYPAAHSLPTDRCCGEPSSLLHRTFFPRHVFRCQPFALCDRTMVCEVRKDLYFPHTNSSSEC